MTDASHQSGAGNGRPRIAIVDKTPIVRQGVGRLIASHGRFEVVAILGSGEELLKCLEDRPVDVAVVGWTLPRMTGGEVLAELKCRKSTTRVIVYTGETSPEILRQSMQLGAWAFVSKAEDIAVLLAAIEMVARGRLSFPRGAMLTPTKSPLGDLTLREREHLSALASGLSNPQIAIRFGISRNTVKYHLKQLYEKLGVTNRAMAIALLFSDQSDKS